MVNVVQLGQNYWLSPTIMKKPSHFTTRSFFVFILFFGVMCTQNNHKDRYFVTKSANVYNPYYVFDVWETCFTQKFLCKKLLTRMSLSNTNEKNDPLEKKKYTQRSDTPENIIEKIFFGRSNEQIISEMTKFSGLFKRFVDHNDKMSEEYLNYINSETDTTNIFNVSSPVSDWKFVFDELSRYYISNIDGKDLLLKNIEKFTTDNEEIQCYHYKTVDEIALLIHKLHVYLMVETMTSMVYSLPQTIYYSEDNHDSTDKKRQITETQKFTIKSCSGNTYAAYNPETNSYYCACYSDKNCFVDINSIVENETIHPILIISIVPFVILLCLVIYQGASNTSLS